MDGKKASLRKICRTETQANNQVSVLDENTEKAMSQLAKIYEKCEDVGKEMVDADLKKQR